VVNAANTPLPGATVTLTSSRAPARTTTTDSRGSFSFADVPAGTYEIEIRLAGFVALKRVIIVSGSATAPLTLTLLAEPSVKPSSPPPVPKAGEAAQAARDEKRIAAESAPGGAGRLLGGMPASPAAPLRVGGAGPPDFNTEAYDRIEDNDFRSTRDDPLSTFSIDVDTASYANVRRFLNDGRLPPPDAVRIEEMINYFRFDYGAPKGNDPFAVTTEVTACPWNRAHRLALVGLQARPVEARDAARNLVFLLDVSGSMASPDKLPLVRKAMRMLVDTLGDRDRIAIVVYAGASGLVLPTTAGDRKERIHEAIARLNAGGSTNGGAGITLAYRIAQEQFVRGGINRVILATDGDFNVGVTNQGDLIRLIEEKRDAGVFLSVLGVGTGNLKDSTMEKLADKGNGNYSYLDSLHEARKVLVAEAGATLVTVAKDVKVQVEFNPAHVAAYRLIGYENRLLRNQDFNNDRKDAGEIGAGHSVTALYEIVPPGVRLDLPAVDPLRYQRPAGSDTERPSNNFSNELMLVKLRYKEPEGDSSKLLTFPVANRTAALSKNTGFAAAVAQFGMLLRKSTHRGAASYGETAALARRHRGSDETGYRAEFVRLVELADALTRQTSFQLPASSYQLPAPSPSFPLHDDRRSTMMIHAEH
ncbi:MAG: YfbK domain-containing protein, partial [Vicinamibacterales bacterium]